MPKSEWVKRVIVITIVLVLSSHIALATLQEFNKAAICDYDLTDDERITVVDPAMWVVNYVYYGKCDIKMDVDKDGDCDSFDLWQFVTAAKEFKDSDMIDFVSSLNTIDAGGMDIAVIGNITALKQWYNSAVTVKHHDGWVEKPQGGYYLCLDYSVDAMKVARKHTEMNVLHIATSKSHAFNAFLVCDDWRNISCWRFLEPQTGEVYNWYCKFGCPDEIEIVNFDTGSVQKFKIVNGTLTETFTGTDEFEYLMSLGYETY